MNNTKWTNLLKRLHVETTMGRITPARQSALDRFEKDSRVALPSSYREYCSVFGAGEVGRYEFKIAVPGFRGQSEIWSLSGLQDLAHEGLEYGEYSPDPDQHARGVFFASDILGAMYFFDPEDVTNARKKEYAVYVLSRDWKVRRIADDFWQFVTELCLGSRHGELIEGDAEQLFRPVSK